MWNALELSTALAIVLLGGLRWLKPESTISEMGSKAEAVECLVLKPYWEGRAPNASMMDKEEELLQYLHCRAEQGNGLVGAALVSWLLCLQNQEYYGVLPNCWDVNSGN